MELLLTALLLTMLLGLRPHLRWRQPRLLLVINGRERRDLRHIPLGLGLLATRLPMWFTELEIFSWYRTPLMVKRGVSIRSPDGRKVEVITYGIPATARMLQVCAGKSYGDLADWLEGHTCWEAARKVLARRNTTKWLMPIVDYERKRLVGRFRKLHEQSPDTNLTNVIVQDIYRVVRTAHERHDITSFVLTGHTGVKIFGEPVIKLCQNDPLLAGLTPTLGNALTAGTVAIGLAQAAASMGIDLSTATVAVVGGYGSIGRAVVEFVVPSVGDVIVIGLRPRMTQRLVDEMHRLGHTHVRAGTEVDITAANVVIVTTSADDPVVRSEHIREDVPVLILDVSEPNGADTRILNERPNTRILDGGAVVVRSADGKAVPCPFGFSANPLEWPACAAEGVTIELAGCQEAATRRSLIELAAARQLLAGFRNLEFGVNERWRGPNDLPPPDWWEHVDPLRELETEFHRLTSATA